MAHYDSKQTAASSVPSRTLVTRAGEDMRRSPSPVPTGHSLETEPAFSPVSTQILCTLNQGKEKGGAQQGDGKIQNPGLARLGFALPARLPPAFLFLHLCVPFSFFSFLHPSCSLFLFPILPKVTLKLSDLYVACFALSRALFLTRMLLKLGNTHPWQLPAMGQGACRATALELPNSK